MSTNSNYEMINSVTVNKISKTDFDNFVTAGIITQEQIDNEVWIFYDDNYISPENFAKLEALNLSEIYSKTEVNNLLNALSTLSIEAVDALPTENISTKTIYLVRKTDTETNNVFDEYLYINGAWEHLGDTTVNLSNYYTKTEVDEKIPTKTSDIQNDSGFITGYTETDPTVPAWAKAETKPAYNYSEIQGTPEIPTAVTRIWNSAE